MSHFKVRKSDDGSAFSTISRICGSINKMPDELIKHHLESNGLSLKGHKNVLLKRLKEYYRYTILSNCCSAKATIQNTYDFIVVVDFEATCEQEPDEDYLPEIIEFPAVLIDVKSRQVIDTFHSFCQPTLKRELSDFCKKLTGIKQEKIHESPKFVDILHDFEQWLTKHKLLGNNQTTFVTDGNYDFGLFLNVQCKLSEVEFPTWARKWINIKKFFSNFYKSSKVNLTEMIEILGLEFEGRLHNGFDDAKNIGRVVCQMLEDHVLFEVNESLRDGQVTNVSYKRVSPTSFPKKVLLEGELENALNKFNSLCLSV